MSPAPRNHVIDAARAFGVLVVVVFHALLYQVRLEDGRPVVTPWAPPHLPWWPLSWVFMVIPLFFVAGGYGHAVSLDRRPAEGSGYARFLAHRGGRLVGPLLVFITACAGLASAAAWLGHLEEAVQLSRQLMQLLWFIAVYLVIIAAAPLAVRAHDRWGWRPMAVLLLLAAMVDAVSFAVDQYPLRNLNMLLVWPLVHQLGIAYERGWFRRGPAWTPWAAIGGGAAAILVLVLGFGYPGTSVGFADLPIANVQPPTIAMVFLAVAQCGVLALVEQSGALDALPPLADRLLSLVGALMMSAYLWHIGCIAVAGGVLLGFSLVAPTAAPVLLAQPTVALAAVATVCLLVPLVARLEYRLIAPLGDRQDPRRAVLSYVLLVIGTGAVWLSGTVVHPAAPASSVGVLLVWLGIALVHGAAGRSRLRGREAAG